MPKTSDVLSLIGDRGVIVGSWPKGGTKDIDVVIKSPAPKSAARNPVFTELLEHWRDDCSSSATGHLVILSEPTPVEVFEDVGWPIGDEAKDKARLTFSQARRRATYIDAYGVTMRAVI